MEGRRQRATESRYKDPEANISGKKKMSNQSVYPVINIIPPHQSEKIPTRMMCRTKPIRNLELEVLRKRGIDGQALYNAN